MSSIQSTPVGGMLVGYRFKLDDTDFKLNMRGGSGATVVVDQPAIAGPIFLGARSNASDAWHPDFFFAACAGCNAQSREYKTRSIFIMRWAHTHRCEKRMNEPPPFIRT